MNLSRKQRVVVIIGGAIILLMLIMPPWATRGGRDAGYGLIFDPSSRFRIDIGDSAIRPSFGDDVHLDASRLFIQALIVSLITAGVVFVMKKP